MLAALAKRANRRGVAISQMEKSTPGGIRTPNPRFRRPMLYPIELRVLAMVGGTDQFPKFSRSVAVGYR